MTILVAKIKPYKAVRIPFLAQELTISTENVISLLVELLLEGKI